MDLVAELSKIVKRLAMDTPTARPGEEPMAMDPPGVDAPGPALDFSHDVNVMSEVSRDGRVIYIDASLPRQIPNNGKALTVADPLVVHETVEWEEMKKELAALGRSPSGDERKRIYLKCHAKATAAEKQWIETHGYDWASWEAWNKGQLARLENRAAKNPPPDPDVRPLPHDRRNLETTMSSDNKPGVTDADMYRELFKHRILTFDRASLRSYTLDGYLKVETTNISKANICPYVGKEIPDFESLGLEADKVYNLYRHPDELAKAVDSFNTLPLLRDHEPVLANKVPQDKIIGATGSEAVFEYPYLRNALVIWNEKDIDDVESETKKELSSGYRYRADMTPGVFEGERYDGVMRDIVGNHVALVREGRAGSDVMVGDSADSVNQHRRGKRMPADKVRKTGTAALTASVLANYLRPRIAKDQVLDLGPILKGLTAANFSERKYEIVRDINRSAKGKLAMDADIGEVAELLNIIENHGSGGAGATDDEEELVPEPLQDSMEDVGELEGEKSMDDDPSEAFLREKLGDDDYEEYCNMKNGAGGQDDDIPAEEEVSLDEPAEREEMAARIKESEENLRAAAKTNPGKGGGADEPPPFTGKPKAGGGMDSKTVQRIVDRKVQEERDNQVRIRVALDAVRPYVGNLGFGFDSAAEVYERAFKMMGEDVRGVHPSAYPKILEKIPLAGQPQVSFKSDNEIAQDAAAAESFHQRNPDAARIKVL